MDAFITAVLARWMDNADLAAIGQPYQDVAPKSPPATYAVFTIKPSGGKVEGWFDRTSKMEKIHIEFTIYSTAGVERELQATLHDDEGAGFDFASFSIDDGSVRVMHRIGQSSFYAGTDSTTLKPVYAASSIYEATVQRFVSTP